MKLISKSRDGNLILNNKAIEAIKEIQGNLAVLTLVGTYRSGKSTLLNHLIRLFVKRCGIKYNEYKDPFEISHYDSGCTKGLEISNFIPRIETENGDLNLIFIDSEVNDLIF
jgi:hypothetical protein